MSSSTLPVAVQPVNPASLSIEDMARLLSVGGKKVTVEQVREHVAAGAPVAADGTMNLVHYAAWLNKQMAEPNGD
jgi:hypothetical protein